MTDFVQASPASAVAAETMALAETFRHEAATALDSPRARRWLFSSELVWVTVAVAVAGWLTSSPLALIGTIGVLSLSVNYVSGRDAVRPGLPRPGRVVQDTTIPFAGAGLAAITGWITLVDLRAALLMSLAGSMATLAAAGLRQVFPVQVRTVVVGSPVGVAEATTMWAKDRRIAMVGSLVVQTDAPRVPRPRTGDGSVLEQLAADEEARALRELRPDLVLVVPGPGVDSDRIRRIGWALEDTGAGLSVLSGLEGIAPHRINHTSFAGASLMHLRSSRPSAASRASKAVFDRVVGALILAAVAPVLGLLVLAIRLTSPGAAIFKQVRVGQHGEHFTMYKLRTMVVTAEADKAALLDSNEGNGLLFKKEHDPRITKLGHILRKYSLDELPQLINVVKGDMSLVGPRPALPEEVAQYTVLERRRLAARPGMTGAWQVSGRSTLGRDESVRLDVDYTDNYRFVDDLVIGLRTVDAVVRPKGAW